MRTAQAVRWISLKSRNEAYQFIRDFHIAKREEDIGFYAGYVGSSCMLGRALTSVLWGLVADRCGRKPVIIIGSITVVNFWVAITTRFLLGALNGFLGPIKGVLSIPLLTSYTYIAMLSGFSLAFLINCASVMKNVLSVSTITGLFLLQNRAVVLSIPLLTSYTYIAMLSGFSLALLINCASVMKNVLSLSIITGLFLLQNRAVHQRGAANGLAMTVGGALFSWSQKRQDAGFLPGNQMVFFILNLVEALGVILTFKPFLTQRAP